MPRREKDYFYRDGDDQNTQKTVKFRCILFLEVVLNMWTDAELITAVHNLDSKVKQLRIENAVFYRFLEKNDMQAIREMEGIFERISQKSSKGSGKKAVSISAAPSQKASPVSFSSHFASSVSLRGSASHKFSTESSRRIGHISKMTVGKQSLFSQALEPIEEKPQEKINITQKSDLVARDLEDYEQETEKNKNKALIVRNRLVARTEELKLRAEEVDNMIQDFQTFRECEQIPFLKLARFLDESSKKMRLQTDKYRLRYSSTKLQYKKAATTLVHKKEIGEHLQKIDFEQLEYENANLVKILEQKYNLLMQLKKMTGAENLLLCQHKKILQKKEEDKEKLTQAIKSKEADLVKADIDLVRLYNELGNVKDKYEQVRYRYRHFKAPEVLDYIRLKDKLDQLKKEVCIWEKRKDIRDRSLYIEIEKMKRLLRTRWVYPCWFEEIDSMDVL